MAQAVKVAPARPAVTPWGWVIAPTRRVLRANGVEALSLIVGIMAWEGVGQALHFPFLPPLSNVLRAWWELFQAGKIVSNLLGSLLNLAIGFALAASSGLLLGALMGRYRKVEYLLDIYINALLASPHLVFVPVFFIFFGVSQASQIAVIYTYAVFIIIMNTQTGIRTLDPTLLEMARSFGARERQLFWQVMLPGAMPLIMAGLRLGMGRAVKGMINGEMFIALTGLGALTRTYGGAFDSEKVLAILITIIAVAVVATSLIQALDRWVTRWAQE